MTGDWPILADDVLFTCATDKGDSVSVTSDGTVTIKRGDREETDPVLRETTLLLMVAGLSRALDNAGAWRRKKGGMVYYGRLRHERENRLEAVLRALLGSIDYRGASGFRACTPNEAIGAVLPTSLLALCDEALEIKESER